VTSQPGARGICPPSSHKFLAVGKSAVEKLLYKKAKFGAVIDFRGKIEILSTHDILPEVCNFLLHRQVVSKFGALFTNYPRPSSLDQH